MKCGFCRKPLIYTRGAAFSKSSALLQAGPRGYILAVRETGRENTLGKVHPMSKGKFYITTPIYYVNDKPHIGHSYTTILCDVLARYHKLLGEESWFLTGTDEHGQKVQKAATEKGMTPIEQCDSTVVRFQELWTKLGIANDDFIRTTEPRHKTIVQKILQDLYDRGEIYRAEYKGRYCVPCERFYTDKDLLEGQLCPECKRGTNEIVESNYFFKMGKYQDWLVDYIKTHPDFILPSFRANETLGFLKRPLEDLCISRPKSRLAWGIELPFDKDYVCYVWFDALINYISAIGYGKDDANFRKWWPSSHNIIGKDILTTHTVYWPTMLKAMGEEPPKTIFAHGWWLSGQDKMSKSLGNVVNPMDMIDRYGVDAFRYFLMAEMSLGQDASFTEESFITRYNSDLANDLGNMLSRAVKLTLKHFEGKVPAPGDIDPLDAELRDACLSATAALERGVRDMKLDKGLEQVMNCIRAANRYMEKTAPWSLAKKGDLNRLGTVLYTAAEALRIASGLLLPVMPAKMTELRATLGIQDPANVDFESLKGWGGLKPGSQMRDIEALFLRIKPEEKPITVESVSVKAAVVEAPKAPAKDAEPLPEGVIIIDDFLKVQLKTAKVLEAERVKGADKLLKLKIELGSETRPLVAGIAKFYTPEEMLGKTIIVVANLKPRKLMGIESQGMLLAAKDGDSLKLVTVEGGFKSGCSVG